MRQPVDSVRQPVDSVRQPVDSVRWSPHSRKVKLASLPLLLAGCVGTASLPDGGGGDDLGITTGEGHGGRDGPVEASPADSATADSPPPDPRAYLHVNLWSTWWNDRTRCGAERTFLRICTARGGDCSLYQKAYDGCDPNRIIPGQVGPEKQGEADVCGRSRYPDVGGCVASKYDFDRLRFWWYGAAWQGNWPAATVKVFEAGANWMGGGELIALSNVPGAAQAAMASIDNHGLGFGCAMRGVTSGDDMYRKPFGGFAWIEVPTGKPLTVVGAAATNFADQPFAGCARGAASQDPWVIDAPGAQLGCVYLHQSVTFEPGGHYYFRFGKIERLPTAAPPQELVDGFAMPEVGVDISTNAPCAL